MRRNSGSRVLCAEERCLRILEGKSLMDGVASAGKGQSGQGGRQNGDGAEHGGEDFGFCSGAKGSLGRIVIGKFSKIGCSRDKQG